MPPMRSRAPADCRRRTVRLQLGAEHDEGARAVGVVGGRNWPLRTRMLNTFGIAALTP
jgi:hypothetical protein